MRDTLTLALKLALKALTTPGIFTKGKYQCNALEQGERV
jgi:hypothetical protein